jgi:hypothetical protein
VSNSSGTSRKVRQYVENCEWGNIHAGRMRNHFRSLSGWHKTGLASVIILLLTSEKNCSQPKKTAHQRIKLLIICNKFAHGESILLTENHELPFILHSACNLSMDSFHNFYLYTNYSKQRKFAHSKGKLCTKIKFAQSKKLLKIAHSRNLLTEFARSIEKVLTMKNLADLDGSTQWLNVLHQANRSTVGAHHSTVSFVTAGTCWAGCWQRATWHARSRADAIHISKRKLNGNVKTGRITRAEVVKGREAETKGKQETKTEGLSLSSLSRNNPVS